MVTISLCMIVRNEEAVLRKCLASVKDVCDEIVIVDTGSTDKTKEIASKFTDKVFDFEWIDDFSAARNFSFDQATSDYIFWLDADDILLEKDKDNFKILKKELTESVDVVSMIYNVAFDEYGNPTFSYRRNRLVKRKNNFQWIGAVHEYLKVHGQFIHSDIAITHEKSENSNERMINDRNLKIYEKRIKKGEEFSPRDLFYYANELKDHQYYQKALQYYQYFLATKKGWVEDEIRACINMAACYRTLDDLENEIDALIQSINYDVPYPEVSCRLGDLYKEKNMFKKAILWYVLAVQVDLKDHLGFQQKAYSTWYPHLQLCVCYWEIGEKELAIEHNNKAKMYRPNDSYVKSNEKLFQQYLSSNN